jgi:DNA-binding YbaB/EbfC family protein
MAKYKGPGKGAPPNMQNLLKQAQKMQEDAQKAQEELLEMNFTAQAGGGAVRVTIGGDKLVKEIAIDPEIVDPEDVGMLSDIVMAAVNEAIKTVEEESGRRMGAVTGGLNFPGM